MIPHRGPRPSADKRGDPASHRTAAPGGYTATLRGANAGVVGFLGAALYDPVWVGAVGTPRDFLITIAGFVALVAWKCPSWLVVVGVVVAATSTAGLT